MHYIFNIIYIYMCNKTPGNKDASNFSNYRGESPDLLKKILAVFSASGRLTQLFGFTSMASPNLRWWKGTVRSPCISSKRASFSCNCLTNCCMKLIEIMRVWYNIYMYMYMYEVCIFMYVEIVLHTNRLYDICHAKFHMFYSRYATILLTLSLHWRILKNRMSWSFIAMTITTFHQPLPSHLKNDAWPKRTCWSKIKLIARMGLWRG